MVLMMQFVVRKEKDTLIDNYELFDFVYELDVHNLTNHIYLNKMFIYGYSSNSHT